MFKPSKLFAVVTLAAIAVGATVYVNLPKEEEDFTPLVAKRRPVAVDMDGRTVLNCEAMGEALVISFTNGDKLTCYGSDFTCSYEAKPEVKFEYYPEDLARPDKNGVIHVSLEELGLRTSPYLEEQLAADFYLHGINPNGKNGRDAVNQ